MVLLVSRSHVGQAPVEVDRAIILSNVMQHVRRQPAAAAAAATSAALVSQRCGMMRYEYVRYQLKIHTRQPPRSAQNLDVYMMAFQACRRRLVLDSGEFSRQIQQANVFTQNIPWNGT